MSFDIEKFPSNEAAIRMLSRVSPIYKNSYIGKWLFQVMGIEIGEARKLYEELRDQSFPETATWGINYWEQRYGIVSDETLSLEERRKKVIVHRGIRAPINPAKLEQVVYSICNRIVSVEEDNNNYRFTVKIEGDPGINFETIVNKIKIIKPSHIAFDISLKFIAQNQRQFCGGITCTEVIGISTLI